MRISAIYYTEITHLFDFVSKRGKLVIDIFYFSLSQTHSFTTPCMIFVSLISHKLIIPPPPASLSLNHCLTFSKSHCLSPAVFPSPLIDVSHTLCLLPHVSLSLSRCLILVNFSHLMAHFPSSCLTIFHSLPYSPWAPA